MHCKYMVCNVCIFHCNKAFKWTRSYWSGPRLEGKLWESGLPWDQGELRVLTPGLSPVTPISALSFLLGFKGRVKLFQLSNANTSERPWAAGARASGPHSEILCADTSYMGDQFPNLLFFSVLFPVTAI